ESIRMLLRPGSKRVVVLGADRLGEPLVLDVPPPEVVHADRFDVDADLVHHRDAVVETGTGRAIFLVWRPLDDVAKRHVPVAVDVDDFDALAGDTHLPPRRRRLRAHPHAASRQAETGTGSGNRLEELSAIGHGILLWTADYRLVCFQRDAGL